VQNSSPAITKYVDHHVPTSTNDGGSQLSTGGERNHLSGTLHARTPYHNHSFLTVVRKGRLGNQIYQYAALYGLSRLYPQRHACLERKYKRLFKTFPNLSIKQEDQCNNETDFELWHEKVDVDYNLKFVFNLPDGNLIISGFFVSFTYFENVKYDLRFEEFKFSDLVMKRVDEFI